MGPAAEGAVDRIEFRDHDAVPQLVEPARGLGPFAAQRGLAHGFGRARGAGDDRDLRRVKAMSLETVAARTELSIGDATLRLAPEEVAAHPTSYTGEYLRKVPGIEPRDTPRAAKAPAKKTTSRKKKEVVGV